MQQKPTTQRISRCPPSSATLAGSKRRGVVTLEAMITLCILVIAWAGATEFGKLAFYQLRTQANARDCAWRMALSYCEAPPKGCVAQTEAGADPDGQLQDVASVSRQKEEPPPQFGDSWNGTYEEESDVTHGHIDQAVSSGLGNLLMKRVTTTAEHRFEGSPLLASEAEEGSTSISPAGGRTITVQGGFNLPCNSKPQKPEQLAASIFNDLFSS